MSDSRTFVLRQAEQIAQLISTIRTLDLSTTWEIIIRPAQAKRTIEQNAKLHAILNEIAQQVEWEGRKFTAVVWKRLCMASWLRETGERPMLIPALDGSGVDIIFERTSKLNTRQCASLTEWCLAFGAEHNVRFRDTRYGAYIRE